MDEKISLNAIEKYSEAYSQKVLDAFFRDKQKASGKDLMTLCGIQQINHFILLELFGAWREENEKIKSPYFDYDAAPVKESLENLMSTLSNHISVDREDLSPLLGKAVRQTMLLILDPYDFFSYLIAGNRDHPLDGNKFQEILKYIKINRSPLERLYKKLESAPALSITGNEAFGLLDQILEEVNFTPEDIDSYIEKFSAVELLTVEQFYPQKETPIEVAPQVEEPKIVVEVKEEIKTSIHTSFEKPKETINESMQSKSTPRQTLVDGFQKIANIKTSLSINQKFMFTKVLFHGDFELFSQAIDDLDRQDNLTGALRYLETNHEEWDRESEEFHEFMEILEKRFN
jgi:hypothetical protein